MLTKPAHGWSDFQLEGTSAYGLSYLDDIAFEWVDQAIHGLETMRPFCVKGFLEPNRFLCTVSYWNCYIICENDERDSLRTEDVINELSHTSMLQFCQYLYDDIKQNVNEWISFNDHVEVDAAMRKTVLTQKLTYLKDLISEREKCFGESRCFL